MPEGEAAGARGTRVMIVDDDPLARYALRAAVETLPDAAVVAEAGGAREALEVAASSLPELVLVDIQMAGLDGLRLMRALLERHPAVKVLVLSVLPEDPYAIEALRGGAAGYLRKEHVWAHLREAVRATLEGGTYLHPSVAPALLRRMLRPDAPAAAGTLTCQERQVLRLLAQGLSNKEIGAALGATVRTVKAHISRILRKLDVQDRTQAAVLAVRLGLAEDTQARRPAAPSREPEL